MINDDALRETLIALAEQQEMHYKLHTAIIQELAALRDTVKALDPTFWETLQANRRLREQENLETVAAVSRGLEETIRRLKAGLVC
jgi:hypothetical protein